MRLAAALRPDRREGERGKGRKGLGREGRERREGVGREGKGGGERARLWIFVPIVHGPPE